MTRYLIKATYLEGSHEGKSYLLRKGGYPTVAHAHQWEDTTYATLKIAQRECRRLAEQNAQGIIDEDYRRAKRERLGLPNSKWRAYEKEAYEPYPVQI